MFPCILCDVKLNSVEQRKAHCRGKNHVKRVAAREKALEIGTDFDHTPDHCEICNVPLTSKMTAIDHFKGKMHLKKVKAVEDLRQGFRNFCDVCEVRLQSLKVSEAHFNGKQHRKRERKMNVCRSVKDKNQTTERKANRENAEKVCDISQTSFIVVPNQSSSNSTSTWESLNCDSDSESKDPLSEFRSSLSGKSSSPDEARTPHSTSPKDPNESYFSFEKIAMLQQTTFSNSEPTYNHFNSNNELSVSPTEFDPSFLTSCAFAGETEQPKVGSLNDEVFQINDVLWETKAKHLPNYLNETCNSTLRESSFIHEYRVENGVATRTHDFKELTQRVLRFFAQIDYPISCDDLAKRIGCASPGDVRSVLCRLEKRKKLSKSGYNPTLWSARVLPLPPHDNTAQKQPYVTSNTQCQTENYSRDSCRETPFFQKTTDTYLINNVPLPTTQAAPPSFRPSAAILSNSPMTASRNYSKETVIQQQPLDLPPVFEANVVNLFQQNQCPITTGEILTKLGFPDEMKLRVVLHDLLQRRVITKESPDTPQRWRLASAAAPRLNDVGVIGEERKRKSPVQNNFVSSKERSTERIRSSPPQQNGFFEPESPVIHQNAEPIYNGKTNGVWRDLDRRNGQQNIENGVHQKAGSVNHRFPQDNHIVFPPNGDIKRHEFETHGDRTPPSPSSTIQIESDEFLEDLTMTPPNGYQKELYQEAMQEDIVCYVPTGTGQGVVMASVVHHMILLNPSKQALIVVEDTVSALERAECLEKELSGNEKRKKVNVAVLSSTLKQQDNKRQVVVTTSTSCLRLLNCGVLSWKHLCLLVFDQAGRCTNDHPSHQILRDYYLKAKADVTGLNVPKLLGFLDSSSGEKTCTKTVAKFSNILRNMGDVFLCCVTQNRAELEESKQEAMFVCVLSSFTKSEQRMFSALHSYLLLVFDHLASQCQPLNNYRELLQLSFQRYPINGEAFAKFVRLTGKPLDKRLSSCCVKTWRHYLAICEVMFALVECGEDFAKVLLGNLKHEAFGFSWANEVGLPVNELSLYLLPPVSPKKLTSGNGDTNLLGSGIRELIEQLQIIQWENARVSSERPLALVIVKLSKTAKALASYLARYPELAQRNVKTAFIDGTHTSQQRAIVSAIKRRQYQVIVSADEVQDDLDLPHCELVILMDQPTPLSALVKLRQRQGTNVVAICREAAGEEKLKELLKKEEDVEKAITKIREN